MVGATNTAGLQRETRLDWVAAACLTCQPPSIAKLSKSGMVGQAVLVRAIWNLEFKTSSRGYKRNSARM